MRYKTPAALEMAVKEAAKKSPLDTNRAIAGFYFHRLLCRVFSDPDSPFVLKGGQSVLARTVDARATRDIDLLARETSVEAAVADLRRLAGIGLDDFISFSFDKAEPIKADDEYRSGMKVWFTPSLGGKSLQAVSVDLVDVVVYAKACRIDSRTLAEQVANESRARKVNPPERFQIPDAWPAVYGKPYAKKCTVQRWYLAPGNTSAIDPTMPATLSPVNMRTPRRPRDFNHDRKSRQHSLDSVKPSAQPTTSRHPSSFTPIATMTATFS